MKKLFVVSEVFITIKVRARDMDVSARGEKELEVRAMEGLSRNVSRRKQVKDVSTRKVAMPILKSEVQDAREL